MDVTGVVNGTNREAWKSLEDAVWKWCARVRQEITGELKL